MRSPAAEPRAGAPAASVSVIVPTWRRPADLARCLRALSEQARPADEVLVVLRPEDRESHDVARAAEVDARIVFVAQPGQVGALNAGLEAARGAIVAITDDDAAPRRDWIERIERHLSRDRLLAGAGGRDYIQGHPAYLNDGRLEVGRVQPWGRIVGNHHLGIGPPRHVDVLKGCNMAFRRPLSGSSASMSGWPAGAFRCTTTSRSAWRFGAGGGRSYMTRW